MSLLVQTASQSDTLIEGVIAGVIALGGIVGGAGGIKGYQKLKERESINPTLNLLKDYDVERLKEEHQDQLHRLERIEDQLGELSEKVVRLYYELKPSYNPEKDRALIEMENQLDKMKNRISELQN